MPREGSRGDPLPEACAACLPFPPLSPLPSPPHQDVIRAVGMAGLQELSGSHHHDGLSDAEALPLFVEALVGGLQRHVKVAAPIVGRLMEAAVAAGPSEPGAPIARPSHARLLAFTRALLALPMLQPLQHAL
jgi:hypothetical protein